MMKHYLAALLLLVAVAIPAILYATQGERESLEARVAAFKHENGDVEFAIQVKEGPEWGERLLPRSRTISERSPTGRWLSSSPVALALPEVEKPAVAAVAETPDGHHRFDVAIALNDDDLVVVSAVIDGEQFEWPTDISLSAEQLNVNRQNRSQDNWGGTQCSQSATTTSHYFAPSEVFNEDTLTWTQNSYSGFSVSLCDISGRVLTIVPRKLAAGRSLGSAVFYPGEFRVSIAELLSNRRYVLPTFDLSPLSQDFIRQIPCTSDDINGLPHHIGESVVGYAINSATCRAIATRTLLVTSDGALYGRSGDRLDCRYSVDVARTNEKFAQVSYTFNQGCELRLVGGGNSETYYLVGDFWNSYSNRR